MLQLCYEENMQCSKRWNWVEVDRVFEPNSPRGGCAGRFTRFIGSRGILLLFRAVVPHQQTEIAAAHKCSGHPHEKAEQELRQRSLQTVPQVPSLDTTL